MLPVVKRGLAVPVATNAVPEVGIMTRVAPTVVQKAVAEVIRVMRERRPSYTAVLQGVAI